MKNKFTLSQMMNIRSENLHFLRFVASIFVIVGHAFVLCDSNYYEVVYWLTGKEITLGRLAVAFFFFASGLFIARSIEKKNSFKEYFKARCIRIFPLLWIVIIITVVFGVFVSEKEVIEYYTNLDTGLYLLNCILILKHELPGVFQNNYYGPVINGSLWTLPLEFLCYIVCFVCYHTGMMKPRVIRKTLPLCVISAVLGVLANKILHVSLIEDFLCLCIIFYIGMVYYVLRNEIEFSLKTLIALFFFFVITIIFNISWLGILMFFPYALSWLFFTERQIDKKYSFLGDYSYAMYLCAFPIQQLFIHLFGGNMNPYINIVLTIFVTLLCAIVLIEGVEKRIINKSKRS